MLHFVSFSRIVYDVTDEANIALFILHVLTSPLTGKQVYCATKMQE